VLVEEALQVIIIQILANTKVVVEVNVLVVLHNHVRMAGTAAVEVDLDAPAEEE
jgi:hypothetical protein